MKKVYRNELLKGVISLSKIDKLLGKELEVITHYRGKDIIINVDDNYSIICDLYNIELKEAMGGSFDYLGEV